MGTAQFQFNSNISFLRCNFVKWQNCPSQTPKIAKLFRVAEEIQRNNFTFGKKIQILNVFCITNSGSKQDLNLF
jgi:hypothetical protein